MSHFALCVKGRGVPNKLAEECNHAKPLHPSLIPSLEDAVTQYQSRGGHLAAMTTFGEDPLAGHMILKLFVKGL